MAPPGSSPFDLARIGHGLPVAEALDPARWPHPTTVVLQAPPGTGKTTFVPPLVANASSGRVIVTQPRRVAARAAAARLAHLAGVRLGSEVGYRIRGESRVGPATRIEFCTTGILLRRLLAEPDLPGVAAVILDEVHERQIDTDLTLGMVRDVLELRDDLTVVAMSATIAADRFAALLGTASDPAPVVAIDGALHPLDIRWAPAAGVLPVDQRGVTDAFLGHVTTVTAHALAEHPGDALVFLPGVREVERVAASLRVRLPEVTVLPLHGRLGPREQDAALAPSAHGRRVVVATSVAESSLTVPGVRIVVDSGLARQPRFDSLRGLTGLVTRTESRAAAEQRAGRAAREAPGVAVRCFAAETWARLDAAPMPEMLTADLTRPLLDLACWGAPRGAGLALLDPPPTAAADRAEETLRDLGAVDAHGRATDLGRRLAQVPVDPRLARALFTGATTVGPRSAAEIVAALESEVRAPGADVGGLLRELRSRRPRNWRTESARLERLARRALTGEGPGLQGSVVDKEGPDAPHAEGRHGLVVASAYPDRIARRRGSGPAYLLSSGTGADLPPDHRLGNAEWLAVAQVDRTGSGSGAVIRAAAPITEQEALEAGAPLLREEEDVAWAGGKIVARRVRRLGAIVLTTTPVRPDREAGIEAVRSALHSQGLDLLTWPESALALRRRMAFLARHAGEPWPTVDDAALLARLDEWLGPELIRLAEGTSVGSLDLAAAVRRLLPWPEAAGFDALVPERLEVPTGSRIRLDYPEDPADRPVLAVKLQECFGLTETPRIVGVPVLFHLLSPAGRPLAVTDDLASFWTNAYPQVRAENRGRYAKHPWPEDPLTAPPRRGTTRSGR